jgi:hypothetical protein
MNQEVRCGGVDNGHNEEGSTQETHRTKLGAPMFSSIRFIAISLQNQSRGGGICSLVGCHEKGYG